MNMRNMTDEELRVYAARHTPGLAGEQRFELIKNITDDQRRCEAARNVPDLTDEQRAELRQPLKR